MNLNGKLKILLLIIGFTVGLAEPSTAGTFTMKQCEGSFHLDFQAVYSPVNGSQEVDVVNGCTTTGAGKIGIYQDRDGTDMSYGSGGQFRWTAPAGARVFATRFTARLKDANGARAQLVGFDGSVVRNIDGGSTHDGTEQFSAWSDGSHPQSMVIARLLCDSTSKCANRSTSPKAFLEVTDAEFTVDDYSPPVVSASGELWNWAGDSTYHSGSSTIRLDATDLGSGLAAGWAEVNGLRADLTAPDCPGDRGSYSTRFTPCPLAYSASRSLDTWVAPFQEGPNQIRLCVRDYASTEAGAAKSCTSTRTLLIDSKAPNPPLNIRSDQGTDWQPENGFTLRWETPAGQVAPIMGAAYILRDLESGAQVDSGYFGGTGIESVGPVEVPGVGAYRASIYLLDSAGNIGHPAETILRLDDRPPGNVNPEPAAGWFSRDELPVQQEIQKAEPGGPSGISGYALRVSDDGPSVPCSGEICLAPEITLSGGVDQRTGEIEGLSEGSHWVSAAAVSGARRSSMQAGTTQVKVDRTPPSASIAGVPNEWVNHPVTITVQATDSLSGMKEEPGDDGEPKTFIDASNYAVYDSPGPVATFSVATDGVNRISYWAEDLAGNANDGEVGPDGDTHAAPGQAVVRIDTTPPEVVFETTRDMEDPEVFKITARDAESGVLDASVSIRPAGSGGELKPLETTGHDGQFQARVPSDDLGPGAYELVALVRDRAGNVVSGNQTRAGDPMIVTLPLKQPAELTSSLEGGSQSLQVAYGTARFAEGRLTSDGVALANQPVRVEETFATGSRQEQAIHETRTDGDGRYRIRLDSGSSREIIAIFDGTTKYSRTSSRELRLSVKGRTRFRIKPGKVRNGAAVRMRGSIGFQGVLPPARGKLVAIQYLDPSRHKWRPVEVLRTDRRGRFRYSYRFRTITSAQRIIFRANALPEAGWPYLPSTSKPKSVIVYPKKHSAGKGTR